MLEGLGSSFIRMIGFRDVWAFVGQKGIQGFSPLEEVSNTRWLMCDKFWEWLAAEYDLVITMQFINNKM